MKHIKWTNYTLLFLLIAVVGAVGCEVCASNLVLNPGFESDLASWSRASWEPWTLIPAIDTATKRSGSKSLKIVGSGTGQGLEYQDINVVPGEATYTASGWIKSSSLATNWYGAIKVEFYTSGGGFLGISDLGHVSGTADWTYVRTRYDVPVGTATMKVYCVLMKDTGTNSNTGTVWFDDLDISTGNLVANGNWENDLNSWYTATWSPWTLTPAIDTATKHSGSKSLKIVGSGTGQGLEYQSVNAISNETHYTLSGWMKSNSLATNWYGAIKVEFYTSGGGFLGITDAGHVTGTTDWTEVDVSFEVPEGTASMFLYCMLGNAGAQSNSGTVWFDDISLKRTYVHNLVSNGTPFFPTTLYFVLDSMWSEIYNAGFNSLVIYNDNYTDAEYKGKLNAVAATGLYNWCETRRVDMGYGGGGSLTDVQNYVNYFKDTSNLWGWYIADEPEYWPNLDINYFRDAANMVASTDPNHPRLIVNCQTGQYPTYIGSTDIGGTDCYPAWKVSGPNTGVDSVLEFTDILRTAAAGTKPILMVNGMMNCAAYSDILADREAADHSDRTPTLSELRAITWGAIIHGARGIGYWAVSTFSFDDRECPKFWEGAKAQADELEYMEPVMLAPDSPRSVTISTNPSAKIRYVIKEYNSKTYLIAMNESSSSTTATISIEGITTGSVYVLSENTSIPLSGGSFSDTFAANEVHIYTTNSGIPNLILGSLIAAYDPSWSRAGYYPSVDSGNYAHYGNGAQSTASSVYPYRRSTAVLNGGYGMTAWSTDQSNPWLWINLGQSRTFDTIKVCKEGTSGYSYTLQYWNGTTWVTFTPDTTTTTYKKWNGTNNTFDDCLSSDPNVECRIDSYKRNTEIAAQYVQILFPYYGIPNVREVEVRNLP
ncbi:MAG: carbohydrate binding domain-containing protein [Armatimonadota bacterium]